MIPTLGLFALILALLAATVQVVICFWCAQRGHNLLMRIGRNAAFLQAALLSIAFVCLAMSFLQSDFSIALVAEHSHSDKPLLFKLAATWGNHEGSLTLWVLVLALAGAALAAFGGELSQSLYARALGIQAILGCLFLTFLLFASNPFARLHPPALNGIGLNPVLQDPALAIHPPFLYLGYVGFSIPFSLAIAALIEGSATAAWARWLRFWSLASWSALTIGIALGSWWAYRELGWGGFWFWDPVENASLMPWLVGIALLHCAIVAERRGALRQWTILLAILSFSLAILGTFLVRSGVLVSVHSFATDPTRGVFVLSILATVSGGALLLFALRAWRLPDKGLFAPVSREGAILINNLLLCCGSASIFVGTLYPLALEALNGAKISVGAPFFNLTFAPLMLPLFLLLPLGPALAWKQDQFLNALKRLHLAVLIGFSTIFGVVAYKGAMPLWASLAFALAVWILVGVACESWLRLRAIGKQNVAGLLSRCLQLGASFWGMSLAHSGVGVLLMGIISISAWSVERIETLRPGDSLDIAGFHLSFQGLSPARGANFLAEQAKLRVHNENGEVFFLYPERRIYPIRGIATSETAIDYSLSGDLYVVLGDNWPEGEEVRLFRFYWNPLVSLIWLGAGLMAIGGVLCLAGRRYHVGFAGIWHGWEVRREHFVAERTE